MGIRSVCDTSSRKMQWTASMVVGSLYVFDACGVVPSNRRYSYSWKKY